MIEPSSTTALHPPAPAPCAATSAARRAPPPRSRTALGFARSALGARPRVGREGEGAFSNTHIFTFSTAPPSLWHATGEKWELRTASRRPPQNQAGGTGSRATGFCTNTGTFLSPRIVALHQHRYLCWIASFISTGTLCTASAPVL